ncbi:MAG: DUF763 domain-containing protein, partial [Planctomycetota bacterium]
MARSFRRTGTADLPLHGGRAPRWLTSRMRRLARAISVHIVEDSGPTELLRRLSDPHWFQAFGCVLGFDWHSSGVTTTVCGALKGGLSGTERELGLFVCGGKGGRGRKTPQEIDSHCQSLSLDGEGLTYASRMSAKVDSAAVQDGHEVYHHCFIFTAAGEWATIQQGMNTDERTARRYHWLGESVKDFVEEPHAAVCASRPEDVLNLVAEESAGARDRTAELARTPPEDWLAEARAKLGDADESRLVLPKGHMITPADYASPRLKKTLLSTFDKVPADFEALLGTKGVGAKTLRALALASELIYGEPASARDPARFSFAHGGKDGHPYPVDRTTYDRTISLLGETVNRAKIAYTEK